MVVFSAAQGNETAHPYQQMNHGLFTYYLLKKFRESQGNVSFGALEDYVKREVARKSILSNKKSQTPKVTFSPSVSKTWREMKLK